MLALKEMVVPKDLDPALADITNTSTSSHRQPGDTTNSSTPTHRQPQSFDAISSQILGLTTIATSLQKEMAQLSRRSKDNATDLISLKEATNSRDEDIRKSLKDLASNLTTKLLDPDRSDRDGGSRSASSFGHRPGSYLLDSKPHNFGDGLPKSFSLPRMGSPGISASELSSSSWNAGMERPASLALLGKIFDEMGTKEGQDSLAVTLGELKNISKISKTDPQLTKKLEEILILVKDSSAGSRALVPRRDQGNGAGSQPPRLDVDFDPKPAPLVQTSREVTPQRQNSKAGISAKAADFVNEDLQKLLQKMKDSIAHGGGMTAEVKKDLRELRAQVLIQGRDIAEKLDHAESTKNSSRDDAKGPGREEIAQIVQDGLFELREHMENLMRERRRQSSSSMTSRHSVDSQEVYTAVKNALVELPMQQQLATQPTGSGIEREEILEAVREAWEHYKPEIDVQNYGLERDEVLQCLKEGLQEYQPQDRNLDDAHYEVVLDAVREGLQDFKPPAPIETEANITRDEILMTVRECLESFEFPAHAVASRDPEITRDEVLDAVREGLSTQAPISKEIEFNRDDLFEAVKAGLQGTRTPMTGVGEQVLEKMEELIDGMRVEFKEYSEANGGDTEQVLDAMKDGLENLRKKVESYVDRAADVTGKDEIIDTIKNSMDQLRDDLEGSLAEKERSHGPSDNGELLDMMEREFEHLRQVMKPSSDQEGSDAPGREAILDTIREGLADMNSSLTRSVDQGADNQTMDLMKDEFEHLREVIATSLLQNGASSDKDELLDAIRESHENIRADIELKQHRPESILSNTSELLDAFNDGLDSLKTDVEKIVNKPTDMTVNYEILETLKEGLERVRLDLDGLRAAQDVSRGLSENRDGEVVIADPNVERLHKNDIGNLEMMIAQLRIKVEALDNMPQPQPQPPVSHPSDDVVREQMQGLEDTLHDVQASVADLGQREQSQSISREDIEAFETLLRNTKAKVDDFASGDADGLAKVSHLESMESILNDTRGALTDLEANLPSKRDIGVLEALLHEVQAALEELRGKSSGLGEVDSVSKTDIEALETLCMDTKTQISELPLPDPEQMVSKEEVLVLDELLRKLDRDGAEQHELQAQAFEARKIEHGGLADKLEDLKLIFEDVREELNVNIKDGSQGVRDLAQTLDTVAETIMAADATASVDELRELVKMEFEAGRKGVDDIKDHSDQNHKVLFDRHATHKDEIIGDLKARLDVRFDELMTKYDDAQFAAKEKEKAFVNKDVQQEEVAHATKTAAEDLKILVNTLGSTVSDSCERMSEDSKTVFSRVDEVGSKLDELLIVGDGKADHQATRAEISKVLAGVEGVQVHASEYHPKILDAMMEILGIVGQHYEQAKTSTEEIKTSVQAIPGAIPLPAIAPTPEAPVTRELPSIEPYDDTALHSKLDQLVSNASDAGKTAAESALLEQIREQVATTATQMSDFIAFQQQTIAESSESKAKEAEEAAVALEKRVAQKEIVEADIVRLSEQKAELGGDVETLRSEKDSLTSLKNKMQADLSSLEMALQIRREELQVMESRADGLERRILDNVLDHSRSLLATSRPPSSLKDMNLKRVTSNSSNATATTRASSASTAKPSPTPSAISSGIGMAMKRRQPQPPSNTGSRVGQPDRRILSLSTLGSNRLAVGDRAMVLANTPTVGGNPGPRGLTTGAMKRSHSVKSNFGSQSRKSSWGGTNKAVGLYGDDPISDKENSILDEEDEEEGDDGDGSEADTERRTSYSGTYTGTGSYGEGSTISSDDHRTSLAASSTVGTIGTRDFAITEDGREDSADEEGEPAGEANDEAGLYLDKKAYEDGNGSPKRETGKAGDIVLFGQNSDSGIGSDMPTAQLEGGSDYFRDV